MCSCKTQKFDANIQTREGIQSEVSVISESEKIDTTKTVHIEQIEDNKVIKETIIEEVYDKDSGTLTKKTTTEREIAQDTNKVVVEEEDQSVTERNDLKAEQFRESTKNIDSEVKEESVGSQEAFGKYLGIVIGIAISLFLLYLLRKLRIN
jgi:tetrahydromethanopterin S-methyltransferase subunit A